MQHHEQPLAPTAVDHAALQQQQPLQPLNTAVAGGQGPLSGGTTNTGSFASPTATSPVHNEPIPQTMGPKDAKNLHKHLEKEAKAEDKNIKHQIKDIGKAEKAERKAEKADSKALKGQTKAEEKMHSANKELERAQAKHDQAIREAEKARKEVEIKKQHHVQITQNLQSKKAELDNLSKNRESHHHEREGRLSELDKIINSAKS